MKSWILAVITMCLSLFAGEHTARNLAEPIHPQSSEKTRFSNIKFTLGQFKVEQSSPNMILRPAIQGIDTQAKMVINPASAHTGSLKAGCEAAWAALRAGKELNGEVYVSDPQDVPGGGKLMSMGAQFKPEGGAAAIVVVANGKITKLSLTSDTDVAFQLCATFLGGFIASIEMASDQPNPSGSGAGGPATGPDPGDSFDWDGPDRMEYGIYDHDCRHVGDEYDELLQSNDNLVDSVKPRTVNYQDALNAARLVLQDPAAKTQYDKAAKYGSKEYPKVFLASAATRLMDGDSFGALAQILAGVDASPNDATLQFNLASILAAVNMPNESLAVIKHLEGMPKKPEMAAGIEPGVAMNYLTGYNEMLRGKLPEASTKLKSVINADSFINEASHCLALVAAKQGGNGKSIFKKGLFRFPVRKTVFCVEGEEEPLRPSVDEMFDCSKGVPGQLCDFRQPTGIDTYKGFAKVIERLMKQLKSELDSRKAALAANPVPFKDDPPPYDVWADKFFDLMQGLDEREPVFLKLQADIEKSREDFKRAAEVHYGRLMRRLNELAVDPTKHKCSLYRDAASQALNGIRPHVVHLELMHRRYAKSSYRILTGMLSYYGKGKWRDCVEAYVRSWLTELDTTMVLDVWSSYGPINAGIAGIIHEECLANGDGTSALIPQPNLAPCPPGVKKVGFKYALGLPNDGPKVGGKVDCEGVTFEVEFPFLKAKAPSGLVEYGAGAFAQVEMKWGGDWTVFMGAKGSLGVGSGAIQEKAGIYVKGSVGEGATELGGRVSFEGQVKAGDYTISKTADSMDFAIIPAPKAPKLGPGLKGFRNLVPNSSWTRLMVPRNVAGTPCCAY